MSQVTSQPAAPGGLAVPLQQRADFSLPGRWFAVLCAFIALTSIYDAWLVKRYEQCILYTEENPLALWLIELNGGDVSLFLYLKIVGTLAVVLALWGLRRWAPRIGLHAVGGVAGFQFLLILILNLR